MCTCTRECVCMCACSLMNSKFNLYVRVPCRKEFSQSLGVSTLSKWAWEDEHVMESSSSLDLLSDPDELEELASEPNAFSSEDTPELETSKIKHSVVFKCVGVKKEYIEKVLISTSRKLDNGDVPVRIRPKPDNPDDV